MAKLFRKVRQKLLSEKRVGKYFTYAIGEILLVVIGILLALQINAINQKRQRVKLQNVLLAQLKFELLEIYVDVWRDVGILGLGDQAHYKLQQYIMEDHPYVDSLCFDFYWLSRDEYIYPTSAVFSRLKEEGLDIIQNDSIRISLQALYEGYFPRLSKKEAFYPDISTVFNEYLLNAFRTNTDLDLVFTYELNNDTIGSRIYSDVYFEYPKLENQYGQQTTIGFVPLDFDALKKDPKFSMLMEQTRGIRNNKLIHYSSVKSIIKDLIRQIDQELGLP